MPIKTTPRSGEGADLIRWLELASYTVRLADFDATTSTGEQVRERLPEDITVEGILWRVATPWNNDSEEIWPQLSFGDTADLARYGILTAKELCSTGNVNGMIPVFLVDTSTGADLPVLAIDYHLAGQEAIAATSGTLELWLRYRNKSSREASAQKRAK